jgi:proton-dependent oligopeptide transporter, POT family
MPMELHPSAAQGQASPSPEKQARMPRGLPYIAVNEAAERYSFYGMRGILTVFMVRYLADSAGRPDPMTESEARIWYHTFTMGVYFLPLIGALLADIFWGKYRTIIALSLVYCLGHAVMALDHTRLGLSVGLALIAIGAGGIKPCVSAHLGDQFNRANAHLLEKAYAWFYFAINVGAVVSMALGEVLLQRFGPHVAFGLPGALMLLATAVFFAGRRAYRSIPPVGWKAYMSTLRDGETRLALLRILPVFALVAVFWSLYDQTGSSWVQQARSELMDKTLKLGPLAMTLLPSQVQAFNPVLILLYVPLFSAVLYPLAGRMGLRLTALRKIGFGMFLAALSFAVIAGLEYRIFRGEEVSVNGQILAYAILTAAEVLISMTCLEFAYTQAPNPAKSLVMGLYFLSLSAGNFLAVEVSRFIRTEVELSGLAVEQRTEQQVRAVSDGAGAELLRLQMGERRVAPIEGRKLMFSGQNGLEWRLVSADEGQTWQPLQGTFLVANIRRSDRSFVLLDPVNRQPLALRGTWQPGPDAQVYADRLVGAEYFWFFCGIMILAGLLFVPVALRYRMVRYLQDGDAPGNTA